MSRYFIKLSYCGTAYNGWQSQPHKGTKTVQDAIEKALGTYLRQTIDITGCGRTDTGVHAKDYYAHFDSETVGDIDTLIYRVNKILPNDIAIHDIIKVHDAAHARFDASSRSYQYHLHTSKSPFADRSYYYFYDQPNVEILNDAASILLEYTDFTTFCKVNSDVHTMNCDIKECYWEQHGEHFAFHITADRFLRGMIRLIVGMCLQVSRGKLTIDEVRKALEEKRRIGQDWSVPAIGLVLCDIKYPYLNDLELIVM
ncbi:MAG: tRNA pseudouridine(38-40) synthase TruA [Saprospiraceae bacterium]|nr:tRNA pseudouridine(38-40) synthase TruA [Saprospiraceae bacterium]